MNKLILLLILLFIPLTSAGLTVNPTSISINKTFGQDQTISLEIKNTEAFNMFNISFEDNAYISMPKIDLSSGETKSLTATIKSNENINSNLKIRGFYESNLGQQNKDHLVKIDSNGADVCDFSIVEGDSVTFINNIPDEIVIRNTNTGNDIKTINKDSNFTTNFNSPEILTYKILRRGIQRGSDCTITALDDSGLINNPELNAILNLDVVITFPATNLSLIVTKLDHNISANGKSEGVLTIINEGKNNAKNISFSGDWFKSFSSNNFDLDIGQSKGIIYEIDPIITNTSETNKSYTKNLMVKGNFNTLEESFNIFVQYGKIDNEKFIGGLSITEFLEDYCNQNPDVKGCIDTQVIIQGNNSGNGTNQERTDELFDFFFDIIDQQEERAGLQSEIDLNSQKLINLTASETASLRELFLEEKEKRERNDAIINYTFGILFFMIISGSLLFLIKYHQGKNKKKEFEFEYG